MRSTSPKKKYLSARSGVRLAQIRRLLHRRFQYLGLPNKEGASTRSLDAVVTVRASLAKGMPYKNKKGELALAIFYEGSLSIFNVISPASLRLLAVRPTLYIGPRWMASLGLPQ